MEFYNQLFFCMYMYMYVWFQYALKRVIMSNESVDISVTYFFDLLIKLTLWRCASVDGILVGFLRSSFTNPGIQIFQLCSVIMKLPWQQLIHYVVSMTTFYYIPKCNWTSLSSRVDDFLCFAKRQDAVTTFSMKSSANCINNYNNNNNNNNNSNIN